MINKFFCLKDASNFLYRHHRYPPARALISSNVPVALGWIAYIFFFLKVFCFAVFIVWLFNFFLVLNFSIIWLTVVTNCNCCYWQSTDLYRSDFNPNAPCLSMPMVMHLAAVQMRSVYIDTIKWSSDPITSEWRWMSVSPLLPSTLQVLNLKF